jgi:LacI family transcriptional regulator
MTNRYEKGGADMSRKSTNQITIHDVAKKANTSATTVSRVLNNTGYPVREGLRQRVLSAREELGYEPNLVAKSLKNHDSRDIGVIIPTVSNPFYASVILGIEEEASKNDYNIFLCNTARDELKEANYIQSLYQKQVRGVIVSSMCNSKDTIVEYLNKGMDMILLDQAVEDMECSMITFDCRKGAGMLVDYLIKCGHRKIAFVSTPLTRWTRKEIFAGYKEALKGGGLPFDAKKVITINSEKDVEEEGFEFQAGRLSAQMFVEQGLDATAVLAVNDMTAFGFIQELNRLGKKVPRDVSVVGFDDISFASMFTPALTTIRYPSHEVGRLAAKLLFEKMVNPDSFRLNISLDPKLIVRDSVRDLL